MRLPESIRKQLAPHVEPFWADALVTELRLRGVAGEQIGATLAEVEAHCADSGASATELFGDPVAYAGSLGLAADPRQEPGAIGRAVAPLLVQVIGMFAILTALPALQRNEPVEVSVGHVSWMLAIAALAVAMVVAAERVLRVLLARPLLGVLAGGILLVALVLPSLSFPQAVATLPAGAVLIAGLLLLAGGVAWAWWGGAAPDPIESGTGARRRPGSRWLGLLAVPAATAAVAGVVLLLG